MEYCGFIIDHEDVKRRLTGAFCTILATVCVVGTACDTTAWDYGDMAYANEVALENVNSVTKYPAVKGYQRGLADAADMLQGGKNFNYAADFRMLERISNGSVLDLSAYITDLDVSSSVSEAAGSGMDEYFEYVVAPAAPGLPEIPADVPAVDVPSVPVIPDISADLVVPGAPVTPIVPDTSIDPAVPDISIDPVVPDTPIDPAVPDTSIDPAVPDTPIAPVVPDTSIDSDISGTPIEPVVPDTPEDTVPDNPSDETGRVPDPLAGFQINEEGLIYAVSTEEAVVSDDGTLELPGEGCSGILSSAFDGAGEGIGDIVIPANITYIEDGTLSEIPSLFGIWVDEGNPNYTSLDAALFDKSMSTLLAFPSGWIGTYEMPESVTRIADYAFANTGLEKISLRRCSGLVEFSGAVFGENNGAGITISVPRDLLPEYEEILAGYDVTLE